MPFCTEAQISQSWRFTRSQKSTASAGSKPGLAISSGWNRKSQSIRRVAGVERPERERHDVIGREAQHEVRVDQLALVAHALLVGEPRERLTRRRPRERERGRAVAMRDTRVPVELAAAALLERGDELAELGMHWATVIALVVVLDDRLPVRVDVVRDAAPDAELRERVVRGSLDRPGELRRERSLRRQLRRREVHEHEARPRVDRHRVQAQLLAARARRSRSGTARCGAVRPARRSRRGTDTGSTP